MGDFRKKRKLNKKTESSAEKKMHERKSVGNKKKEKTRTFKGNYGLRPKRSSYKEKYGDGTSDSDFVM